MKLLKNVNFYGRRRGKKLSKLQVYYIKNYLPKITPKGITRTENPTRTETQIKNIFGEKRPLWLEVGFGGGEHLLSMAQKYPNVGIIGCEPYVNGVAMLLPRLVKKNLENVRLFMDDARILFEVLPDLSISKLFLLFPDPWPKKRHRRRRFINKENIELLKRILKIDALIYIATDVNEYSRYVLETFNDERSFQWMAESASDWRNPWKDWENTRYFLKAERSGKPTTFLIFRKIL